MEGITGIIVEILDKNSDLNRPAKAPSLVPSK